MTLTAPTSMVPWAIPSHSIDTLQWSWIAPQQIVAATVAWGTANRAIYVPTRVPRRVVVRKIGASTGSTSAGNIDVGIYDASGALVVSSGSTAKASSITQVIDVADTTIGPGLYYLALNNDTTTDTFVALDLNPPFPAAYGVLTQTLGSVTLPATASWAVDNTLTLIPAVVMLTGTEVS